MGEQAIDSTKKKYPHLGSTDSSLRGKIYWFKKGFMPKRIQTDRSRILMPRGNNVTPLAAVLVVFQEALPGLWRLKWTVVGHSMVNDSPLQMFSDKLCLGCERRIFSTSPDLSQDEQWGMSMAGDALR